MPVVAYTTEEYKLHILWKDWLSPEQQAAMQGLIAALAEANGAPAACLFSSPATASPAPSAPLEAEPPPPLVIAC